MTTTAAGIEQFEGTLSAEGRPLAALAVSADALPSALKWHTDEGRNAFCSSASSRVAVRP
jgi:hypothetical protein